MCQQSQATDSLKRVCEFLSPLDSEDELEDRPVKKVKIETSAEPCTLERCTPENCIHYKSPNLIKDKVLIADVQRIALAGGDYEKIAMDMVSSLQNPDGSDFLAICDEHHRLRAIANYKVNRKRKDLYIDYLLSPSELKGGGTILLKRLEDIAGASGSATMSLVSEIKAEPFYKKYGFEYVIPKKPQPEGQRKKMFFELKK